MKIKFTSFDEAKKFVRTLNLKSYKEWKNYKSDIPDSIPKAPDLYYKNEWVSWGDFLGSGKIATNLRIYRTFEDARKLARSLNLKNANDWRKYCKSGNKPENISSVPYITYKNEWVSWGDFLGTGNLSGKQIHELFRSFENARKFVHDLDLKNTDEWKNYCKSGNKPDDIPKTPGCAYKNKGWKSMHDWLGIDFKSFKNTRQFARSLNLKSMRYWQNYCKSGNKPDDIPTTPQTVYKKEWHGWGNFLGTRNVASTKKQFKPFENAHQFALSLNLKNIGDWKKFCKSGNKPDDIPVNPFSIYKKEWHGWGNFLGTGTVSSIEKSKGYLPFKEARIIAGELAKRYNLKNWDDWKKAYSEGKIPKNIPNFPDGAYSKKQFLKGKRN